MHVIQSTLHSDLLNNQRRIWLQQPSIGRPAQAMCILLDGEYYVERMGVPALVAELQRSKAIPPIAVIYVSHVDGQTRWNESFCNVDFARFISEQLVPWARKQCDGSNVAKIVLGGLSLTGLAAAHAALVFPGTFSGVLCQSASFWWSNNRLVNDVKNGDYLPQRFRITCGLHETQEYVEHGPGLIQRSSQRASNRAMRDALMEKGHSVSYEEFEGGHDFASWERDLPKSIVALLAMMS